MLKLERGTLVLHSAHKRCVRLAMVAVKLPKTRGSLMNTNAVESNNELSLNLGGMKSSASDMVMGKSLSRRMRQLP